MKIFAYIVSFFAMAEDHGFGRRRGNSKKKNFQKDDIRKASEALEEQVPYKTIQEYMDFEGYNETDWKVDFEGIVESFLTDSSSRKGPELVGKLVRSSSLSMDDRDYMTKYLQLKYAILFLQKRKQFGRYCFYGCWCLPKGALDIGVGYGKPVDYIDSACHDYATCYNCLYSKEIGRACAETDVGNYKMKGTLNPTTGEKFLMCMDPIGSCLRDRCECDLQLAKKLSKHEDEWKEENHRRWGDNPFDASTRCKPQQHNNLKPTPEGFSPSSELVHGVSTMPTNIHGGQFKAPLYDEPDVVEPQFQTNIQRNFTDSEDDMFYHNDISSINPGDYNKLTGGVFVAARPDAFSSKGQTEADKTSHNNNHFGKIIGCCGTAPYVHYYREGQRCCPHGKVKPSHVPCPEDLEF